MKKLLTNTVLLPCIVLFCAASMAQSEHEVIPLYDGVAPGSENWTQKEAYVEIPPDPNNPTKSDTVYWNITKPTLTVYKPAPGTANGAALIATPGGGFRVLSYKNEGARIAEWYSNRGFTVFILKYRLNPMPANLGESLAARTPWARQDNDSADESQNRPTSPPPRMGAGYGEYELAGIADGQKAIQLVRSKAKEYGFEPDRIGMVGFSAGGAVTGSATVRAEPKDRPNFIGMIYSNIGDDIPAGVPPLFVAAAADDVLVAKNLPTLYERWLEAGSIAELHIYAKGGHGFATYKQDLPVDNWLEVFYQWIRQQGFIE